MVVKLIQVLLIIVIFLLVGCKQPSPIEAEAHKQEVIAAAKAGAQGNTTEKVAMLKKVAKENPTDYRSKFSLAVTLTRLERRGEAKSVYQDIASSQSELADAAKRMLDTPNFRSVTAQPVQ